MRSRIACFGREQVRGRRSHITISFSDFRVVGPPADPLARTGHRDTSLL
jgi:hypothetical protein